MIGSSATALLKTDSLGIIQTVTLSEGGSDYTFLPHISVKTSNTAVGMSGVVTSLDLRPRNYKTIVTVANSSVNSVGTGYAFAVSEGIIYQKGLFLKVDPDVVIVDKFTTSPNNVAVGFKTVETFVNAYEDETLFDNASNTTNFAAPGADRLKLKPTLVATTIDEASANVDFFSLAEWKDGYPYKENRVTAYNTLAAEFARRTKESQGDFVVDPFFVSTKEFQSTQNTTHIDTVIDPGTGYIDGYRVQTMFNDLIPIERSTTSTSTSNQTMSLNYGNYLRVKELAGVFNFKAGDTVTLYDTAKAYITNATVPSTGAITPAGNVIGTARMRSLTLDSGIPGTATCEYKLYLFDVTMTQGRSFRDVRSVYYDGPVQDGIADVVTTLDATSATYIAAMNDVNQSKMLFRFSHPAVKSVSNVTYTIRTNSDTTNQLALGGTLTIGPLGLGETFPYSDGALGESTKKDFIVLPISNTATANVTGTVTAYANTTLAGSGTTFLSDFRPGDWVGIANSTATIYRQVATVDSGTTLKLTTNGVAMTGKVFNFYPALYPIAFENRSDRSITISGSSKTATISLGKTLTSVANVSVVYNKTLSAQSPVPKAVTRNLYVKIHTSNNAGSNTGPWVLGVPGALRLRNVYLGSDTTVNANSTDITKYFYIDAGEDENAYRTSKLVLRAGATVSVNTNQYILVKMDAFTSPQEGFFTVGSYTIDDSANLASLTANTINTLEIPEMISTTGQYYDLRDVIDFRPYGANTANLATTVAGATLNPANTFALSGADQLFPAPDSVMAFDAEYYNYRIDRVTVDKDSNFKVVAGSPAIVNAQPTKAQSGEVTLSLLTVGQYPSLPTMLSSATIEIASKKTGGATGVIDTRTRRFVVQPMKEKGLTVTQPKRYTMAEIAKIDRRLQNVEYFTALSQVENKIKDKVIPSAITPSTSRYKHGFFVEPFEDYAYIDTGHREFLSSIDFELGLLKPATKQINFECAFDTSHANTASGILTPNCLTLPYVSEVLIDQTIKSAVVGSDGNRTQFIGEGVIAPPSFSISTRGQIVNVPEPVNYDGTGNGGGGGGGGCGGGCFTPDTLVLLADGTTKPIKDIAVGDVVMNADGSSTNKVVFIEKVASNLLPMLYTPTSKLQPFATVNHPLWIDGAFRAPNPEYYLWLNTKPLDPVATSSTEEVCDVVYNLWVDGDHTYEVNGYGTSSIIDDGGAMLNCLHANIITEDQINEIIADMLQDTPAHAYGAYLINKALGHVNVGISNRILASFATAKRGTIRRHVFGIASKIVGGIAKVVTGK